MMKGRNMREQIAVLMSKTGITALSFRDFFLAVSYSPSNAAEVNARYSHMVFLGLFFLTGAKLRKY